MCRKTPFDVLVLELDGTAATINLALQLPVMFGLALGLAQEVILKHREIIRDDQIVLTIGPVLARHGTKLTTTTQSVTASDTIKNVFM